MKKGILFAFRFMPNDFVKVNLWFHRSRDFHQANGIPAWRSHVFKRFVEESSAVSHNLQGEPFAAESFTADVKLQQCFSE